MENEQNEKEKIKQCRLIYLGIDTESKMASKSIIDDMRRGFALGGYDELDYYEFGLGSLKRLFNAIEIKTKCSDVEDIGELPEEMKSKIDDTLHKSLKEVKEGLSVMREHLEAQGLGDDIKDLEESYEFKGGLKL